MEALYGQKVCSILGTSTIQEIPEVKPEDFPLKGVSPWNWHHPLPSAMGPHNLLRGVDSRGRTFIAMKCDILDRNQKKITEVVEFLYKDRPYEFAKGPQEFETPTLTLGADNHEYLSAFDKDDETATLRLFKSVMSGETIKRTSHDTPLPFTRISAKA